MATTKVVVIADAGPLIHLDELSSLDILADFGNIIVPNAVWCEVEHHRPQAFLSFGIFYTDNYKQILSGTRQILLYFRKKIISITLPES